MKKAGILLPVFSLPGKYGIGSLGREAFRFIDFLSETGNAYWQILPMGPTGFSGSPYQAYSSMAGSPVYIDLELLIEDGYLEESDFNYRDFGDNASKVDYNKIKKEKNEVLRIAYDRFLEKSGDIEEIVKEHNSETLMYCLFMAIKDKHNGLPWTKWPKEYRDAQKKTIKEFNETHKYEIGFYAFVQWIFNKQWMAVRKYANEKGIKIIGDIPIYVSADSSDVWSHRELFKIDEEGHLKSVAGVPPDAFSKTGQLWGNPIYDWDAHKSEGYRWWIKRIEYALSQCDVLRIDHFRAFESYYEIDAEAEDAINGKWVKGPGMSFFKVLYKHFGTKNLPFIAEDLGIITDEVRALMNETGFPGMKILEFAFDSGPNNAYLPHNYENGNCVCYTGTHDNETVKGWFSNMPDFARDYAYMYMSRSGNDWNAMPELFIKLAMSSIADTVIIPLADYLGYGNEARINTPATSKDNWNWRVCDYYRDDVLKNISFILGVFGRYFEEKK